MADKISAPPRDTPEYCPDCTIENCPWRYKGTGSLKSIGENELMDEHSPRLDKCVFHSDADITDHQCVHVMFDDGTQGIFTAIAMSAESGRDIMIHGTDGYLEGDMEKGRLRVQHYWGGSLENIDLGLTDGHGGGDTGIVSGFLDSVEEGSKPLVSVEAGVRASLVALAADESMATKKVVALQSF